MKEFNDEINYRVYYKYKDSDIYWFTDPHSIETAKEIYSNKQNEDEVDEAYLVKEITKHEVMMFESTFDLGI